MFSTVDERRLVAVAVSPEGERPVELPRELEDAADRAEALPTGARLFAIAASLAELAPPGVARVRVEVWETAFGGAAFAPRLARIGAAEVEVTSGAR